AECCALLPGLVENAAAREGKRIAVTIEGEIAIEEDAAQPLREALTHLVRNACTHGVEAPETRRAAGKPECGLIRVTAFRGDASSTIEVSDDGRGFDIPALRKIAIKKGVLPADAVHRLADTEIARLALTPGISTAVEITMLSGRGVGLDAAAAAIARLGGELRIASTSRRGTTLTITIPDIGADLHQVSYSRESAA
ncbi:MAG: ATP-binding protein, partial [Hyphomonadaceae bacterium]